MRNAAAPRILLAACPLLRADRLQGGAGGARPAAAAGDHGRGIGHYCGMNMLDHPGPKGQIILRDGRCRSGSRRCATPSPSPCCPRSHTTTGRSTSPTWRRPPTRPVRTSTFGPRRAMRGSSSTAAFRAAWVRRSPCPSAREAAARAFAAVNGGSVKRFAEVTDDYILTPPPEARCGQCRRA